MKTSASAACETGRDGNGLTSTSEPVCAFSSSCQPGNVARRMKVMKAKMMATILTFGLLVQCSIVTVEKSNPKVEKLTVSKERQCYS